MQYDSKNENTNMSTSRTVKIEVRIRDKVITNIKSFVLRLIEVLPAQKNTEFQNLRIECASTQYYCYSKWLCGS